MKYRVRLQRSEEGVSVSVPGLPGCWSQGRNEAKALENIRTAIEEYLAVVASELEGEEVKHIVMSDGTRILTIPRANPINAFTMGGIVKDAGLSEDKFRRLL